MFQEASPLLHFLCFRIFRKSFLQMERTKILESQLDEVNIVLLFTLDSSFFAVEIYCVCFSLACDVASGWSKRAIIDCVIVIGARRVRNLVKMGISSVS